MRRSDGARTGDLVAVFDRRRRLAGIGLYDADSPIVARVLHGGGSRTIDDDFFLDRLVDSIDHRRPVQDDPLTNAYRLVHGENDGLPGLVVDTYDGTLVVRLDTAAWVPHLRTIVPPILDLCGSDTVVLRAGRRVAPRLGNQLSDGFTIHGPVPTAPVEFVENGLRFLADVVHGQKTGHFLDQRENRRLAGERCRDARVLDVFSHTGGFTINALAGGARCVTSIDASSQAIHASRQHVVLNRSTHGFAGGHEVCVGDAFEWLEKLAGRGDRFDVVIIDPPSFAPNRRSVSSASGAYRRLTTLGLRLLGNHGTLIQASCSSRIDAASFDDLVMEQIARSPHRVSGVRRTDHPLDHPVGFPEGRYLKALFVDLERTGET